MKNTLFSLLLLFIIGACAAQSQRENDEKIRAKINTQFYAALSNCNRETTAVTNFNCKDEFWSICVLKNNNRIVTVEWHQGDTYYQEIYFEKNGDLIYAKETENYMPKNQVTQMQWNCEFFTKNGELLTVISLGHGKTESDEWDPDSIFQLYKTRLAELEKIKQ